jgi:enamine deaminase RidA (YjgF/YER057c/UK114 family)
MAPKQVIFTDKAPAPLAGIYNQAIVANGTVYCSGSIGMDPKTGKLIEGDIAARTVCSHKLELEECITKPPQHQIMANLKAVLEAAGTTMDNVVKVNVFIADMKDFSAMNEVYTQYFGEQKPCRT